MGGDDRFETDDDGVVGGAGGLRCGGSRGIDLHMKSNGI